MRKLEVDEQIVIYGGANEGYCGECGRYESWNNRPKSAMSLLHFIDFGHWFV